MRALHAFPGVEHPTRLDRWVRFNGIGALGFAVQILSLAWLVRVAGVPYLWATAIAVEAAVLHNFCWHERWTWRDRRADGGRALAVRLARFHLFNGAISMAGNVLLMMVFTGSMHLDPLAGSMLAITICSGLNFAASEYLVFRGVAAALLLLAMSGPAAAGEAARGAVPADVLAVDLRPATVQAWNAYAQRVETRVHAATPSSAPFFALDAFGIAGWRADAMRGQVAMSRIDRPNPKDAPPDVPDGKIHHWAGAVFVPGTSVPALLERLDRLAGHESKHYEEVVESRLLSREGTRYRIFMKLRRSRYGVTASYNSEHAVEYVSLGAARATGRSVATRIAELENAGTPQEREKTVGSDSGYLWRLNAYWRYEAVNGGVLIECESVSLSRGVPMLLRPFITGVVEGLARDSLQRTLEGLRKVLTQ